MLNKILITILFVIIVITSNKYPHHDNVSKNVTILVVDCENKTQENIYENIYDRYLKDLLLRKYDTTIQNGILYDLGTIQTNFKNNYIAIYINNEYAMVGINDIVLVNNYEYKFVCEVIK